MQTIKLHIIEVFLEIPFLRPTRQSSGLDTSSLRITI